MVTLRRIFHQMHFDMKKLSFLALLFLPTIALFAQNNMGFHSDNYSGVYSLNFNPAEIVDSRYKFHMNLFSLNLTASNNYIGIKRSALFENRDTAFADPNFNDNYLVERLNGKNKAVYQNLEIGYLPSFMFTFGKKLQRAVAFNMRTRTNVNVNGVAEATARQSYNEQSIVELYNVGIQNKNFSIQAAIWNEYGATYGQEVLNTGQHYLKVAGTLKLTQGLASAYFYSDNMDIVFPSDSTLDINNSDFSFGYSEVFSNIPGGANEVINNNRFGFGTDFGVVYEFRPKIDKYKYEMDGDAEHLDPRKNKYMLKVGLGVTDLGYNSFLRSRGFDANFYANRQGINLEQNFENSFQDFENTGLQGFNDTLNSLFTVSRDKKKFYNMSLPTRINFYADYNIGYGFFANVTASIAPGYLRNPEKTRAISEFSITPRYEHKWIGLQLPFSVNTHGNYHMGAGLRLGPLVVGTYDITPLFSKQTIYDVNFYMALSVPITRKLNDRDRDHVSNKIDECKRKKGPLATMGCPDQDNDGVVDIADKCPTVPGLEKFDGCPDKDGDGIQDSEDKCPEVKGLAQFAGCPDTDGDGIQDAEDKCPEVKGLAQFAGCPDTDGDGIQDAEDKCPEVPGLAQFAGCPDTDKDGVQDAEDKCPTEPGLPALAGCPDTDGDGIENSIDKCPEIPGSKELNGCPDTDGDGVADPDDKCPTVKGPKDNNGCPYPDTDGDGVLDKDDNCKDTPGPASNKGCPEIKEKVKEIIRVAFDNLEFESAKAVIKKMSYPSLDALAKVMKENPTYNLKIAGHTDNVGKDDDNMKLSQSRADAVKAYLMKSGIAENRFVTEAYGSTKPVADNKTPAGREKNRRVEMEVIFK